MLEWSLGINIKTEQYLDIFDLYRSLGKNPTDSEVEKMASMLNVDDK